MNAELAEIKTRLEGNAVGGPVITKVRVLARYHFGTKLVGYMSSYIDRNGGLKTENRVACLLEDGNAKWDMIASQE